MVELNPQPAEQQDLFPAYPWGYDQRPADHFQVLFRLIGGDPAKLLNGCILWIFFFPSRMWYLRHLTWPENAGDESISYHELALDFQAATYVYLHQAAEELSTVIAERHARLFSSASKLLGQICTAQVFPDLANAKRRESYQVNVLTALGLGKTQGLPRRPLLFVPNVVHRVLFSAGLEAKLQKKSFAQLCA